RNAKQGRQVEKNRLGNEDGANGLIVQRLLKNFLLKPMGSRYCKKPFLLRPTGWSRKSSYCAPP
ncbi:hypothetical protein, partial [Pseudomonas syringae]|uniref:hypothetical protein n=1 Tax=Pseudomonas syringae TaxID=317 RepID=UPI001FF92F08